MRLHEEHMRSCLQLASKAAGRVSPNPLVGSIIVNKKGEVIGEGYHQAFGQAHAEVNALNQAGKAAAGGTLYVNLEPCCHFGKTPPCVNKIISSGVARVVLGMIDPNPLVSGDGIKQLEKAGIEVVSNVLEADCRWLNRGFIKRMKTGLPWVTLKLATTLDGRLADRQGTSRWISGAEARIYVHQLRNVSDCILVGGATALRDDPELSVRDLPAETNINQPKRVVLDTELTLDPNSRICKKDSGGQTIVFCSKNAMSKKAKQYPDSVKVIGFETPGPKLDLKAVLSALAEEGALYVLCEGGSRLAGALMQEHLIDEVSWFVCPKIIGDAQAIPALTSFAEVLLPDALKLDRLSTTQLGNDVLFSGTIPTSYNDWL